MLFRYPIVRRDLPGRDIQHWLEGDQLIIRFGVDFTDVEVEHERARISRKYGEHRSPLVPLIPSPHRHTVAATATGAAVVTIAASLAVVTGPATRPRTDPPAHSAVTVPANADDPALPDASHHLDQPAAVSSPAADSSTLAPAVPSTAADVDHPIRSVTGPHPMRSIARQHPVRRLITPAAGTRPIRRLLSPTPKLPMLPSPPRHTP